MDWKPIDKESQDPRALLIIAYHPPERPNYVSNAVHSWHTGEGWANWKHDLPPTHYVLLTLPTTP